ncbi:GNAT family N-acetyltransferase, partial [Nonomuraea wenchangensis]
MSIQPVDLGQDQGMVAGLHEAYVAANADDPGPLLTLPRFRMSFAAERSDQGVEMWVATEGGKVTGGYSLGLPRLDNTHTASVFPLVVRPERRGRGLGAALFEHAVGR